MKEVGARLRRTREALAYPEIKPFAEDTGVTEDALSSWERGVNRVPDYYLRRLKERFAITSDWILFNDPSGLPQKIASALFHTNVVAIPSPRRPR